ncbi:PAS domain-containing protein [Streptomyces sp. KR80]|uniref:PAS domain-containing protein n=1 Tax=Streptomyces sp. KR80 TaxID=3457426 RepID=UPI003FD04D0B
MGQDTPGRRRDPNAPTHAAGPLSADGVSDTLQHALGGSAAGIAIVDPHLRYRYVNAAFAEMTGMAAADLLGRSVTDPVADLGSHAGVLRQVLHDGEPREATAAVRPAGSRQGRHWWYGTFHRLEAHGEMIGLVGILLDVTTAHQRQRDLERARAGLVLLEEATARIGTTLDPDVTCAELADFLVPSLADLATVEVFPADIPVGARLKTPGPLRLRRAGRACEPALGLHLHDAGAQGADVEYPEGSPVSVCLHTAQPVLRNELSEAEAIAAMPGTGRIEADRGARIHSTLVVPLVARSHLLGAAMLARAGDRRGFTDDDARTIQGVAQRAAIGIDNARRYSRSEDIALELQRALLAEPGMPHPNIDVACRYLPSGSSALVGGDGTRPYGCTTGAACW